MSEHERHYWEGLACAEAGYNPRIEQCRPSTIYKPRLFIDGDKWCALFGVNLQDGVAGFGDSPAHAFDDFDSAWIRKLD